MMGGAGRPAGPMSSNPPKPLDYAPRQPPEARAWSLFAILAIVGVFCVAVALAWFLFSGTSAPPVAPSAPPIAKPPVPQ